VLTVAAAWAANRDDNLLSELPRNLKLIRTRSMEPRPHPPVPVGELRQARSAGEGAPEGRTPPRSSLRSHLGHLKRFPDAHVGWLPYALDAARRQSFDVAYSSSGPFTSHLIGLLLKRLTGRPWVAELRDGWYRWNRAIFPDYPGWRDVLERRVERAAIRTADRVILVTDRMANAFRAQYADLPPNHFAVVSNGFDPNQFEPLPANWPARRDTFEVLHTGALYYGRSLAALLAAAQRVCDEDASFKAAFRLSLLGTFDATARSELSRHPLSGPVRIVGQVDHHAALDAMRSADLLLLVANTTPGAEATVPGKLFEYLAAGRPILAIAPAASSTADVLDQTGGGWQAPSDDVSAIACALRKAFSSHQNGRSTPPDPARVARFDRQALAGDLAQIFEQTA
jgi:glycosyltransferase involved in cell wall biosynthesis